MEKTMSQHFETAKPSSEHTEIAAGVFINDIDPEEERRLVRKIDLCLLPCIWVMYLLSYMDRTNIGNAKIAGMATDLDLDSGRYSIALVVFFVGYVVFEVPSNMILERTRPSIYLPSIMFLWGIVTICMAWVQNYHTLVALRLIVGILESGFAPGILLILSSWYKPNEQSKRFALYISAAILSGAFGGLIAGAITSNLANAHGIRGWRWLFVVEGAATSGFAIVASFILPDFPANTKKFTAREKELAIRRLYVPGQTEDRVRLGHKAALRETFTNWRTWLFVVGYMAIVGASTLTYFYPTLVKGLGYSSTIAQYMTIPIYIAAFICTVTTAVVMDMRPKYRGVVIAAWMSLSMICSIIICVVYNFKARYALLVFLASGLWVANASSLAYASTTFGAMSNEARAISLAFVNAMGNLAQIYGSYLFPSTDAPKYIMGFGVISGLCLTGVMSYATLYVFLKRYPSRS